MSTDKKVLNISYADEDTVHAISFEDAARLYKKAFKGKARPQSFKLCLFRGHHIVLYRKARWHHMVFLGDNRIMQITKGLLEDSTFEEIKMQTRARKGDVFTFAFDGINGYMAVAVLKEQGIEIQDIKYASGGHLGSFRNFIPESWEEIIDRADTAYKAMAESVYPLTRE